MKIGFPLFKVIILLSFSLLTACGGGGGSSPGSGIKPLPADPWTPVNPSYSGMRTPYEITANNASEVAYSVIESLDLLNSLAFGDYNQHFYFLTDNRSTDIANEIICESGSIKSEEVVANAKLKVEYSNCVIEGVKINGIVRSKVNTGSNYITVILDLAFQDISSGETETFTGYFDVNDTEEAIYHILISSSSGGEIWFNNFNLDVSLFGDEYGIYYSGDMYISDKGKLTISTSNLGNTLSSQEYYSSTVSITGSQEIILNNQVQYAFELIFSDQYIPLIIPLTEYPESLFDDVNVAPVAVITADSPTVDRNTELTLSSLDSTDQDYDLLTFTWEIIQQPENSQATVQQLPISIFIADLPGDYSIRLIVEDTSGTTSSIDKTITVLKNKPDGVINFTQLDNLIGQAFIANISLTNDQYDGPYAYKIKYGPANMVVDENGQISWDGVIPDYGRDIDVNFAIFIENAHKNTVLKKTIPMKSVSSTVVTKRSDSQLVSLSPSFQVRKNNTDNVYFSSGKIQQLVIEANKLKVKENFLIGPNRNGEVYFQAVSDVNKDGVDDYWFSYISNDERVYQVSWMDGATGQTNEFTSFDSLLNNFLRLTIVDYDLDGSDELVIANTRFKTKVFNIDSKQEVATHDKSDSFISRACDFNNDGFLDFVYRGEIIDVKNNTILFDEINYFDTISSKGGTSCEITFINNDQIILKDIETGIEKVIYDLPAELRNPFVTIGDFDNDANEELLVSGDYFASNLAGVYQITLINDLDQDVINVSPVTIENPNNFLKLFVVKLIADLDGDGIDELVYTDQYYNEPAAPGVATDLNRHMSYSFEGNLLKQNYVSEAFTSSRYNIENWDVDDTLTYTTAAISSPNVVTSVVNNSLYYHPEIHTRAMAVGNENGTLYIYRTVHPNRYLTKQDMLGNEIWSTDILEGAAFGIDKITMLENGLILVERTGFDSLVRPDTGEVLISMVERISFGGTQFAFHSTPTVDYLADMRTKQLLQIDKDYNITVLSNDIIDTIFSGSYHYSFLQYDDDLQPELIAYSTFNRTYETLDLYSLTQENASAFHDGSVGDYSNISSNLKQCFGWDANCRNFISSQLRRDSFEVVDKLTGTIIWQSPKFGSYITDIKFKKINNRIDTAVSFYGGHVYTLRNIN